jgi:hypothetical protein
MDQINRTVDTKLIAGWIKSNNPRGTTKLSSASEISSSTIEKVRLGYVPRKPDTRKKICKAMGVSEDRLFPIASGARQASEAS